MQRENPLHASPKPELVQKSPDLLSQGQEILTSGAKVGLGGKCSRKSANKQREQRNKEEIPLFLVQSWLCFASDNCTSAIGSKGDVCWQ